VPVSFVNLDALIRREDFEIKNPTPQHPSQLAATFKISDLEPTSVTFQTLRKPDFQRETASWEPEKIVELVRCFLDGDLIPAVILWRSPDTGNIFVIDGAHRIGAFISWVHDDYGDGAVSKSFFDQRIPKEQITVADKTRILMRKLIGSYQDVKNAASANTTSSDSETLRRARNLASFAVTLQWVNGDARKAEDSFFKINQEAAPIDEAELKILQARNKPNALGARAIVRAGTGHQYWGKFKDEKRERVIKLAKEIHDDLFTPPLETPIKSLDLPLAGKVYSSLTLPLLFDLINISNDLSVEKTAKRQRKSTLPNLPDDLDGDQTTSFLENTRKVVRRISSNHVSSLGLHPAVYFYSEAGRHQTSSLLAMTSLLKEFEESKGFERFMRNRRKMEDFLLGHKGVTNQIVNKFGQGIRSLPRLKKLYETLIAAYDAGTSDAGVGQLLQSHMDFSFIKLVEVDGAENRKQFSTEQKSQTFLREALANPLRCAICTCLIHSRSITTDHIKDQRDGGLAALSNAQLAHPYCNSTYKEIQAKANLGAHV
jgi:hypothetical protein